MPSKLKLHFDNGLPGDHIILAMPYGGTPFIYRDSWIDNRNKLEPATSRADFDSSAGNKYYSEGSTLWVKLVVQPGRDWAVLDICRNDLCK
jgi:cell migration-inducing and hyaluronan-binding protein